MNTFFFFVNFKMVVIDNVMYLIIYFYVNITLFQDICGVVN